MARAPFQVLVIPYRYRADGEPEFAVFLRADLRVWQAIAGGGEAVETPEAAARREAWEEAGIPSDAPLRRLRAVAAIPAHHFAAAAGRDPHVTEVPEYSFGVAAPARPLRLAREHSQAAWLPFDRAIARLEWESNRVALRELYDLLVRRGD